MQQAIEFPHIPQDNLTLGLLQGLKELAGRVFIEDPENEELRAISTYLFVISDAPVNSPYSYFLFYQGLKDESGKIGDHYNHYIHSRGQEYMLDVVNREIGPFGPFFNEFQIIMHGLNNLAKQDDRYAPLNILLWGLYASFYNAKKRKRYLEAAIDILKKNAGAE